MVMHIQPAVEQHLTTCDAVLEVISEENRLLKIEQRVPPPDLLERKKALLGRLDEGLAALKAWEAHTSPAPEARLVERLRSRILQILHLDRENEQLLLRYSLSGTTNRVRPPTPSVKQLHGLYQG